MLLPFPESEYTVTLSMAVDGRNCESIETLPYSRTLRLHPTEWEKIREAFHASIEAMYAARRGGETDAQFDARLRREWSENT